MSPQITMIFVNLYCDFFCPFVRGILKISNYYVAMADETKKALDEFNRCVVVLRVSFPQLPMSAAARPDKAFALDISNEVRSGKFDSWFQVCIAIFNILVHPLMVYG